MRRTTAVVTSVAGIAGPVLFASAVIAATVLVPGYDSVKQVISELTARGGPGGQLPAVVKAMLFAPALLLGLFGVGLLAVPLTRATGVLIIVSAALRVVVGTFPCDAGCDTADPSFTQRVHMVSVMLNAVVSPAAAVTLAVRLLRLGRSRGMAAYSLATAVLAPVFFALLVVGGSGAPYGGLYQRISLGLLNAWQVALAVWSWPSPAHVERMESASPTGALRS